MLITPRKIYQVLADKSAERSDYIRVIDDEGEDYLYPKKYFVLIPVSRDIENALLEGLMIRRGLLSPTVTDIKA